MPFSAGPQTCQGRYFATDEMLAVISTVLENVDLDVVEDHGLLDRPLQDQVTFHVYNRPIHDVRLRVTARKARP